MIRVWSSLGAALLAGLFVVGCDYRVGLSAPEGFTTVAVEVFHNSTQEPDLERELHSALSREVRDRVPLYTHLINNAWGHDIRDMMAEAREMKAAGYEAFKEDPFPLQRDPDSEFQGADMVERLTPRAIAAAVEWMDAKREAVGPDIQICFDVHTRLDTAHVVAMCREYHLDFADAFIAAEENSYIR